MKHSVSGRLSPKDELRGVFVSPFVIRKNRDQFKAGLYFGMFAFSDENRYLIP
jgi:hypothetical protein